MLHICPVWFERSLLMTLVKNHLTNKNVPLNWVPKPSSTRESFITELHHFSYEPVLGTSLDMTIRTDEATAIKASQTALKEIGRLENIYSRFDETSELNKWLAQNERTTKVSSDLISLVEQALMWTWITQGAFHPGIDRLSQLWLKAESENRVLSIEEVEDWLEPTSTPFCTVDSLNKTLTRHYPHALNFNALAKGIIVDKTIEAVMQQKNIGECLINIGGDLSHHSCSKDTEEVIVDIEDPYSRTSNTNPYIKLKIKNQAVATSGSTHRGFDIEGKHYSHIINPRTGCPVEQVIGTTVIAPSCATADVLATAFSILSFEDSLILANKLPDVGCHLIDSNGTSTSNTFFDSHIV